MNGDFISPRLELEGHIREGTIDTSRKIVDYAANFGFSSESDFIKSITGQVNVDMGSGFDCFAFECVVRNIDAQIISINPGRDMPTFNGMRREMLKTVFPYLPEEKLDRGLAVVDKNALAIFSHDLSVIPSDSINKVFDSYAVFFYSTDYYRDLYQKSIQEIMRILTPGGSVRISDPSLTEVDSTSWYLDMFGSLGLNVHRIERKIHKGSSKNDKICCVEIVK